MNYNILLIVAVCLIGCETQAYNKADLANYCEECMKDSSTSHIEAHPYRCDAYISCSLIGDQFNAVEMSCGPTLYFNAKAKVCDHQKNVVCNIKCNTDQKFKRFYYCNEYYQCINGLFNTIVETCNVGYSFDETQQGCFLDSSCKPKDPCPELEASPDIKNYFEIQNGVKVELSCSTGKQFNKALCKCETSIPCSANYRLSSKSGIFEQLANGVWVEQPCPTGLNFNLATCTCSDYISSPYACPNDFKLDDVDRNKYNRLENNQYISYTCAQGYVFSLSSCQCHPNRECGLTINIPLEYNTFDAYSSYIHNTNVSIINKSGFFDGSAYLVLSSTSNNDFQDKLEIKVQFFLSTIQKGNTVAILGNGRCNYSSTYAIYIENAKSTNPLLVVKMTIGEKKIVVRMDTPVNFNKWYKVEVVKNGKTITMYVNDILLKTIESEGFIETLNCAYGVGNMFDMFNFVGYMKDVYLSRCVA